jgi:aldose sugar dehydrogenase
MLVNRLRQNRRTMHKRNLDWRAIAWHVSAFLAIPAIPSWAVFGTVYWRAPGDNSWLGLALAAIYALCVPIPRRFARGATRGSVEAAVALGAAVGLLALFATLVMNPSVDYSRAYVGLGSLLVAALLAGHLLAVEGWLSREQSAAGTAIIVLVLPLAYSALRIDPEQQTPERSSRTFGASQHVLTLTTYSGRFAPQKGTAIKGGALAPDPAGHGYLLARANGDLFRLTWRDDDELSVEDIGIRAPLNFAEFSADVASIPHKYGFRVADVAAKRVGATTRIYVSHHYWKRERACFALRVSSITLPAARRGTGAPRPAWQTLFETEPCLPVGAARGAEFAGVQAGGNLEFLEDKKLLLTVGDHQFDGWYRPTDHVQDPKAHYGKTVLIDLETGSGTIFTWGHRNPQGLALDSTGRIWSTEHGPAGGDELNLLRKGRNYGYPKHSYGTEYASTVWPPSINAPHDPSLVRPVFAWVPSIAPTDLVVVSDPSFPRWQGDLLIASLRGHAIFRVRIEGEGVAYVEPIPIGQRVRDITSGKGEFMLLTDDEDIVRIRPNVSIDDGAALFTQHCGGCHDDRDHRIGPNLKGVIGKELASREGYDYSPALRKAGGRWTEDRLHAFISDPRAHVPGSRMATEGVHDAEKRYRIIDYMKYYY